MIKINQIKMKINHTGEQLHKKTAEILRLPAADILSLEIVRRSVDARKKPELYYIYSVLARVKDENRTMENLRRNRRMTQVIKQHGIEAALPVSYTFPASGAFAGTSSRQRQKSPTVIVGMGPAGLFCGYFLALYGYAPILLEQGKDVDARLEDVERFWREGVLEPFSNVQFGEGGAGTFSDGKLNTLVKDKEGRNRAVLEVFVKFGAPTSIIYDAKPHIGTDILRGIVKRIRQEIIRMGGTVRFESRVTELITEENTVRGVIVNNAEQIDCSQVVLAIGHSARETFSMLYEKKVPMEAKSFAVGLRVEHPQEMINESQYGAKQVRELGAAAYKVTAKTSSGRGVYSFCMCPGGYVVNASSEKGRLAVNGMSYSGRDGKNANSAVIVSVTPKDYGSEHPLAGIEFQRKLEERAFRLGKGKIPVQRYGIFKRCVESGKSQEELLAESDTNDFEGGLFAPECIAPECKGNYCFADVSTILPVECNRAFVEGMDAFDRQIKDFGRPDAIVLGVESRTSSPVRICRDETLQSAVKGLYPCGEGAGYAGGITSAAMDGLRIAEVIAGEFAPLFQFSELTR